MRAKGSQDEISWNAQQREEEPVEAISRGEEGPQLGKVATTHFQILNPEVCTSEAQI